MEAMDDRTVSFKQGLYQQDGGLGRFLDRVVADHKGWERLREWMEPHAYELACDVIGDEMDCVKSHFQVAPASITPQYIKLWTCNAAAGIASPVSIAPVTMKVLRRAAETDRARDNNKKKNCDQV